MSLIQGDEYKCAGILPGRRRRKKKSHEVMRTVMGGGSERDECGGEERWESWFHRSEERQDCDDAAARPDARC